MEIWLPRFGAVWNQLARRRILAVSPRRHSRPAPPPIHRPKRSPASTSPRAAGTRHLPRRRYELSESEILDEWTLSRGLSRPYPRTRRHTPHTTGGMARSSTGAPAFEIDASSSKGRSRVACARGEEGGTVPSLLWTHRRRDRRAFVWTSSRARVLVAGFERSGATALQNGRWRRAVRHDRGAQTI
jgi:hypothetical protein